MNPYTVLRELVLPHCAEGKHEAFGANPSDPRYNPNDKMGNGVPVEEHVSLGLVECPHEKAHYFPGQTVHLTDEQAEKFLAEKMVAPAGSHVEFVLTPRVYVAVE